jgi:hypothetical protein
MNKEIPARRVGDRVLIKASDFLGTPSAMATITKVTDFGYLVNIDCDPPEWVGPVDFDGNVLIDCPSGYVWS